MNLEFISNGYAFIPNFIDADRALKTAKQLINWCEKNNSQADPQVPNCPSIKNYIKGLEILCEKTPVVSDMVGEYVLPTYTYARVYQNGSVLEPHVDRESCEVSLTLHLDGDTEWEFSLKNRKGDQKDFVLNPGDAILYLGRELVHWREPYTGSYYAQIFLHYVRSRGECVNHYFDRLTDVNYQ